MKIDQNLLTPVSAVSRQEGRGRSREVDRHESEKKVASEPQREQERSITPLSSQPVVLDNKQVRLRFNQDKDTGVTIIQVVDADSGELVRQIPPEELLNIAKAFRELKGLIISKES